MMPRWAGIVFRGSLLVLWRVLSTEWLLPVAVVVVHELYVGVKLRCVWLKGCSSFGTQPSTSLV